MANSTVTDIQIPNVRDVLKKDSEIRFRREIGLPEAVAFIVGAIIGSGIFISPKGILEHVGSPGMALVVWVLCGFIAMSGAMTMMELQLAMPCSGGYYFYFLEVLGPIPAFLYLWTQIFILAPAGYAILALAIAKYITSAVFQASDCEAPETAVRLIAIVCISLLAFLNCYDVGIVAKLQNFFFLGKILPLIFIIMAAVWYSSSSKLRDVFHFENSELDPRKVVLALYYGGYSFAGWDVLTSITEELQSPNRNMPLAVYAAIPLVTVVYVLTNVAYLSILTPQEFLSSDAIAVTFVEKVYGHYGWVISIFVSTSILGGLCIMIMSTSRTLFVGARNGQFLNVMAHIKESRMTPVPAIGFLSLLSFGYLCTLDLFLLIDYTSYIYNVNNLGIIGIFFYLRLKKPELKRPVKVSLIHPLIFTFSTLFLVIFPIFNRPVQVGVGLTVGLCGLPVYFVFFKRNGQQRKRLTFTTITDKITHFIQKLILCLPETTSELPSNSE